MKRLLLIFFISFWFTEAHAQVVTTTPNIGLSMPCVGGDPGCNPQGHPGWGPIINNDLLIIDGRIVRPTPGRWTVATKPASPITNEVIVVTDALSATTCTTGGGVAHVICQWTGSTWDPVGGGGGGGGGSAFSAITSGSNTTATMLCGTGCSIAPSGSGAITATTMPLSGLTAATALVRNNQSNTYTTGDQSMAAASSFTFPSAAGAAPTASGRCAYDTTANRMKCGFNGSTVTLATTAEMQPLNSNLTGLSALAPIANQVPIWRSGWALYTRPSCSGAGQAVNYDSSTGVEGCVTFSGSISGLTTGKIPKAASASTLTDSIISEAAGVATVGGGLVVGTGPYLIFNTLAITPSDITWTVLNLNGTIRPSTGVFTSGNIVKTDASGFLVDGGAAGSGTWTDSSTNTGTNKTIDAEATGNVITIPFKKWYEVAACQAGVASLIWNSPSSNAPAAVCDATDTVMGTADFDDTTDESIEISERLPSDFSGALDATFVWKAAAITGAVGWCLQIARTPDGATSNVTFIAQGAGNCVSDTAKGTTLQENAATITGVTCTSCAAGDRIKLRISRDANGSAVTDSMTGDAKLIGLELTIRRAM
jgi:hypothetical protein